MPINVLMPALSPTMTEGTLAKWHVKEGDEIASGDVIAEIETDKATMEVEAVEEGRVGKLLVSEGTEGVPVNETIAILLEEGEDSSAIDTAAAAPAKGNGAETPAASPAPAAAAAPAPAPAPTPAPPAPSSNGARVFASPLARRMAAQAGLDITALKGSGPHGRVVKADIDAALAGGQPAAAAAAPAPAPAAAPAQAPAAPTASGPAATPTQAAATPAPSGPGARQMADLLGMSYRLEPLSSMRKVIASRLSESKQTVPHFYLTVECQLDELLKVRKDLNSRSDEYKISVNDFVIRAAALALKKVPTANASFDPEGLLYYDHADISVAVATPSGLITPIIKAAETKGLATISSEMKDLAGRAREGKLQPQEYQGGSFSVSNLGMFGVKEFAAIINPPQGCILAVGAGEQRPVIKDGAVSIATAMNCTLSVDHRVVDGAVGAEFLAAFKKLIEDPLSMLL